VTKNLADPVKCMDEKYRQLKLDNEKIQSKLSPCQADALGYLKRLGFVEEGNVLRVVGAVNLVTLQGALVEVTSVLDRLATSPVSMAVAAPSVEKLSEKQKARMLIEEKERVEKDESRKRRKATAPSVLSEKQKARMLLEEKERVEKEEIRRRRKATAQLIQQDKYVRKHDENWTSKPSAAVNKTGNAISTFRDRHGES
jgi:hypothetical protein